MRRRDRIARAIVRLYPRAWRARYRDEFCALLEAQPVTARVLIDVALGCSREWLVVVVGRPSPIARARFRQLSRALVGSGLGVAIARSSWDLTNYLDTSGLVRPPDHLTHWAFGLSTLLLFRSFIAWLAAFAGETRFVIRRGELVLWLAIGFGTVMFERLDQLYLMRLPWNLNSTVTYTWTDQALRLATPLMMLVSSTTGAVADIELIRVFGKRRPDVPTSILGLNR